MLHPFPLKTKTHYQRDRSSLPLCTYPTVAFFQQTKGPPPNKEIAANKLPMEIDKLFIFFLLILNFKFTRRIQYNTENKLCQYAILNFLIISAALSFCTDRSHFVLHRQLPISFYTDREPKDRFFQNQSRRTLRRYIAAV